MFNILKNTTFLNFLYFPPSIAIGLCRLFFVVFLFSCIFSFDFVGKRRHLSSWLAAHEFIMTHVFPHYFLGRVIVPYLLTPPLETLLLRPLPLYSVFWHIHFFFVSSPYCACFLMDMAYGCLVHHASKYSPYPVQSMCIHWLHILNPIIFPVHDITINLVFWILPKCGACTCPSYRVSFPHILVNLSLYCFPRTILLQNKVWNIFAGTLP